MKRHAFIALLVLLLTAFSSVSAFGAATNKARLYDKAGLLSADERSDIEKRLKDASSKLDMDVIIITENGIPAEYDARGEYASEAYADDLYDINGFSGDGILLLVSVAGGEGNRDYAISTKGEGIKTFTDDKLDGIENAVVSYLKNSNYYGAFKEFADKTKAVKDFRFGLWGAIAAGLGALVGAIRSGSLKSELKSVYSKSEAKDYIKQGSFVLTKQYDIPTYTTVERTRIEKSGTGESSTHVSSSGETHGGTHGKF